MSDPRGHEIVQSFELRYSYPVLFTHDAFETANETLARVLRRAGERRHRLLPVIDSGAADANPELADRLLAYARHHADVLEVVSRPLAVRGGEECKSDPGVVEEIQAWIDRLGICRHSFVLVIGGGCVIDAVGYAAATAHRGVRLIRMPSTVLAQNDAGIGVKNAVNFRSRKNFLGTFMPPFAVINDSRFLDTLEPRDLRSGIAEAIKVALIRDRRFFERLHRERSRLAIFDRAVMEPMIVRCAELHLEHIRTSGDPFELGSARPLDFGHWAAHKLEEMTDNELRHGEAVAIGLALDSLYSHRTGLLGDEQLQAILRTLRDVGFALSHDRLADLDVESALKDFQEHLGGDLCITVLEELGRGVEVSSIDIDVMQSCVNALLADSHAVAS